MMSNVYDAFAAAADRFSDRPAVAIFSRTGIDTYRYADLRALTGRVAQLLAAQGIRPGDRCAILADNDVRWCSAYLGTLRLGSVAVPLDTAYKACQVRTVIDDAGALVLFTTARYLGVAREATATLSTPPRLVLLSGSQDGLSSLDDPGDGAAPLPDSCPATLDDPAVTLYTSGTTSDPKGVVLTHGNLLAEKTAAFKIVTITEQDSILGILPLFHALAQVANLLLPLTAGARVVFLETLNSTEMMRALAECRITALCVVPQFYYLLHQRVMERVRASPFPVRITFTTLLGLNGWLRRALRVNLGRVFFSRVHDGLGGRMRIMVTGGSRFDPRIGRELFAMGLNIIQAYGLTECSGAATITRPGDPHIDTVGLPFDGVEVRILDEPAETNAREHRDGEVLIKGPIVMARYHNRPDATAETIRDGWLYTGDLGYFDPSGRLHITGRKKEMIVLASGKNIYPEEIELVYAQSPFIKEICVMGVARPDEPAAERLHAIVVPDLDVMRERRIVNTREIIRFDIEGLSLQLPHHKRVLSFDVWLEDLPRTTTSKLKRHAIEEIYRSRLAEAARPPDKVEWRDQDQVWAADPHVAAALQAIRAAAKPSAVVTPDANLELDLGLDSMERVELLAGLELTFNVDVPDEAAHRIYTVRELVEALRPTDGGAQGGTDSTADPWARIFDQPVDDPAIQAILTRRPLFTPFAFSLMRLVNLAARALIGLRVSGLERMPRVGSFIVCPNHQSYLDAFLLVGALPYRTFKRLFFVGASEYFAMPFTARLATLMNVVPVDPDANLVRAMQAGGFGLRRDKILVLFPEGERSPDGAPRKFKKGAAILSHQLGVPIQPVAIDGLQTVWPRGKPPQWRTLLPWAATRSAIRFGDTIAPESGAGTASEDRYAHLTGVLRQSIVSMWMELGAHR
ncbi:MAG: AMP-binding protein [Acidobacteria bacterium]|nr:AMP-binding protein [Acidobacteriota bacterium]